MKSLLLLLFTIAVLHSVTSQDPCTLETTSFYSYEQVVQCLKTVPFNSTIRDSTIDTIRKTWQLHVFRDIVKNSPDPHINIHVDIEQLLSDLATQTFDNDYLFQHALVAVFRKLEDGHTTYSAPKCYENISFKQPFSIISYVGQDLLHQSVGISSVDSKIAQFLNASSGVDVTPFVGSEIKSINGQPAVDFIVQWSNSSIGLYKDLGTRFNLAITTFFMQRQQNRLDIPDTDSLTYVFITESGERTITVPWIGTTLQSYSDKEQFAASCLSSQTKLSAATLKHVVDPLYAVNDNPPSATSDIVQLINGEKISYYQIGDQVGVVKISDFGPSSIRQFAQDFQMSLYLAKLNNIPKLLIDLTNNGGGEECLGYALVKYLFPNDFAQNYATLFANSDMIYSELGAALALAGSKNQFEDNLWYPGHWRSTSGNVYKDNSWFSTTIPHTRGGSTSNYTSLIKENYCDSFFQYFTFDGLSQQLYPSDNLMLLSNGRCASTCALFSRHLQESKKAKTIVVGGVLGLDQQIAQVPGGQVYEFDEIMADIERYNLQDNPHAPKDLLTSSRFRFAIREAYSWAPGHGDTPLEFYFEASDFRLPYTKDSATNSTLVWLDSLKYFDICKSWQTRSCNVENGQGVQQCNGDTGKYDQPCKIATCNAGYGLVDNSCKPCSTGYFKNETGLVCQHCTQPAHSQFKESSGLTSDTCPFACASGYTLENGHCVANQSSFILLRKVWFGLIIAAGLLFFFTTVGLLIAFLFSLRSKTGVENQRLL